MNMRQEIRKARFTPVVVCHDDWPWPEVLVATDVSPGGMYVTSERLVRPDSSLRLSFRLGTAAQWEYEGRAVRSTFGRRLTDPGYSGIAVELLGVTAKERAEMRRLLWLIPPPIPTECLEREAPPSRRRGGRSGGRRREDPPALSRRWGRGRRLLTGSVLGTYRALRT